MLYFFFISLTKHVQFQNLWGYFLSFRKYYFMNFLFFYFLLKYLIYVYFVRCRICSFNDKLFFFSLLVGVEKMLKGVRPGFVVYVLKVVFAKGLFLCSVACFENDRNRLREFLISWFDLSANKQSWYRSALAPILSHPDPTVQNHPDPTILCQAIIIFL